MLSISDTNSIQVLRSCSFERWQASYVTVLYSEIFKNKTTENDVEALVCNMLV